MTTGSVPIRRWALALIVVLCGLTLAFGYLNKARCAGPPFTPDGVSTVFHDRKNSEVCYSDIQYLWVGRDVNNHVFPYIHGGITADDNLTGGSVEYPVLTGLLMWLGAVGVHNDAGYLLQTALILAPFGLVTAWMLGRLSGKWALLWAIGPPLVLYADHNWDLPVAATSVAAVFVMAMNRGTLRQRGVVAAILLAVGVCLKLYPGMFLVPLALYVLCGGSGPHERAPDLQGRYDWRGALGVVGAAVATVVAVNLPFALLGFRGWAASFTFQSDRKVDITTNSIWYWGVRHLFGSDDAFQSFVGWLSPVMVLVSFALAVWLGWRRYQREGVYPWVAVSGAMLCGFLLLHKVDSPQYTLWLLPFLVLLRVPWGLIGAYLVADLAMGIGIFRYYDALNSGIDVMDGSQEAVWVGVWGRAVLLGVFFFVFLRSRTRAEAAADDRAATLARRPHPVDAVTPA